ncbi:MAG: NAD(+) synthase [Calditrichia bacterium]|nr:NAD(+) synthase [Calditrichia bacterium]
MGFTKDALILNVEDEAKRIIDNLKDQVLHRMKKQGAVIGISGGIDSSIVLALSAKIFGPERVLGVLLPEQDSSKDSITLAIKLAEHYGVKYIIEDITAALAGYNCYNRRDEAMKKIFPEFNPAYKAKIVLPTDLLERNSMNIYHLTIISPEGEEKTKRMPMKEYLQIVAATNFKQRTRMSMLYYHAERLNYAVMGTGNKNEHDEGFFVKWGDGGADVKPIAHLFKSQVFQLAEYLGVPKEICERIPTTDTYTAECTQEEFFFRLPYQILDTVWYAMENGYSVEEVAREMDLSAEQVKRVWDDITRKIKATEYLRMHPLEIND